MNQQAIPLTMRPEEIDPVPKSLSPLALIGLGNLIGTRRGRWAPRFNGSIHGAVA
ncbi:hypothetical protein [Methylogaea oryzae]|uniref:Uncharacterized protein n=1 Tax=Methylogaea oryzae TaxID=1295382 RepID=A0A8D4VQC6_9GAMM|nr:hypothetical protein [Methylogaea oryzae]BBL70707.1 hypothetical protein MoryE10_13130 [Methylogaea oryzae]